MRGRHREVQHDLHGRHARHGRRGRHGLHGLHVIIIIINFFTIVIIGVHRRRLTARAAVRCDAQEGGMRTRRAMVAAYSLGLQCDATPMRCDAHAGGMRKNGRR